MSRHWKALALALALSTLGASGALPPESESETTTFLKGFTYLKWGSQFSEHADRSFAALKQTGTEWVSFVPIYYMDTTRSFAIEKHPVLSPTDEELEISIRKAQAHGFKILLKPHIDVMRDPWKNSSSQDWMKQYRGFIDQYPISHNGPSSEQNWFRRLFFWRGEIHADTTMGVEAWFNAYTQFIVHFAQMAERLNVEMFCMGTEFEALSDHTRAWESVIDEVRKVYHGKLFYDVNHDGLERVQFWHKLDAIGISAYYPISTSSSPITEQVLKRNMNNVLDRVEAQVSALERQHHRVFDVFFSEAGYTDFKGTSQAPWDFLLTNGLDPEEQALSYRVSLQQYPRRPWLKGVFFWRWSVEPEDAYFDYDHYSPYGKPAEAEIRKAWLSRR